MSFNKLSKFKKINLLDVLFLFLPFSIIAGNLIMNIISASVIFVGINFFYKKIILFIKENKNLLFILFTFSFLNIEFSSNQLVSLISTIGLIRYLLLGLILYFWLLKDKDNSKFFLFSILISLLLVVFSIYIQFIYKEYLNINYVRLPGIFYDEYVAGGYISKFFFSILFLIHLMKSEIYKNKLLFYFILLILYVGVLLSGDRSPLFVLTFSIIIFFIFFKNIKLKDKMSLCIVTIFCFLIVYYASSNLRHKIQYTFDQVGIESAAKILFQVNAKIDNNDNSSIMSYEEYKKETNQTIKRNFLQSKWGSHFITAYEIGKKNFIIGSGVKTFRFECGKDKYLSKIFDQGPASWRCATHPHNIYFEIFSDTGFFGLLIFLYLHYLIIQKIFKIKNHNVKLTAISAFFVLFFPFQTTGSYFSTFNGIFYFINLSIIIFMTLNLKSNTKSHKY